MCVKFLFNILYFKNIQYVLTKNEIPGSVSVFEDGEGIVSYPKKFIKHKSHTNRLLAFFTRL